MAVALGRVGTSVCPSPGGESTKRSSCEAWFALNRRAFQAVLNIAIQAELDMKAEVTPRRRHSDVTSGQELAVESTQTADDCSSAEVEFHQSSSSNGVASSRSRDRCMTSLSDDSIKSQQANSVNSSAQCLSDVVKHRSGETDPTRLSAGSVPDSFNTAKCVRSSVKPRPSTMQCEGEKTYRNVAWTAVDKRRLAELVDQLTTVSGGRAGDADSQSARTAIEDNESYDHSCLEGPLDIEDESYQTNVLKQGTDREPERTEEQELTPAMNRDYCTDLDTCEMRDTSQVSLSSCGASKNGRHIAASRLQRSRKPVAVAATNKRVSCLLGSARIASEKIAKSSAELWTSVDKSLVEDLLDQLLRSFDDIKVSMPETVETGSGWSRGPPSANRRSSTDDLEAVTGDSVNGRLLNSVAYKWKSHLLLRMRTQQGTSRNVMLSRKRRHADRKLLQIT